VAQYKIVGGPADGVELPFDSPPTSIYITAKEKTIEGGFRQTIFSDCPQPANTTAYDVDLKAGEYRVRNARNKVASLTNFSPV